METFKITNFDLYDIVLYGDEEEKNTILSNEMVLQGWVRTNRDNGQIGFIEFNDGTYFKNVQLVYSKDNKDYEKLSALRNGFAIEVVGTVKLTPEMKQPFEVQVEEVEVVGECADDYPLQKKRHTFEFLRDIAHIRPRANTFQAVFRVRSVLSYAVHQFFQERGFIYVHTPEITTNDGEGAGNVFDVTTHDIKVSGKTVDQIKAAEKVTHIVFTTLTYIFIIALALIIIFPFYWMIITSLKTFTEIKQETQTFFPSVVMWSNYVYVFQHFNFLTYMKNTIVVAIFSTIGTLLTTVFAAFAFSRLQFKGREALFMVFLATMMIPGEMMVISNYITVASFGWITNSTHTQTMTEAYAAMIVPFWISVFHIYLLRQNFKQIPNELYLAAKVDGKSDWDYLWKVMVPLAAPTLISITILKFMGTWNSYVWPNLVTDIPEYRLISNGLRESSFQNPDTGDPEYGYQMAASILVTVPLFLLFVFFRKYIMKGVGRAGIKG